MTADPGGPLGGGSTAFPYTTTQLNRAGDRIRKARANGKEPAAEDIQLLNAFRAAHYPTHRQLQERFARLVHKGLDLSPGVAPVTARPLKTPEAIMAKLVRERTRLSKMQDIAGTRVRVPRLEVQDLVIEAALEKFKHCDVEVVKDSREDGNKHGYRAVHLVVTMAGRFAEIQIRTVPQEGWAQIVEKVDEGLGTDLKHGQGPPEWRQWLYDASDALRDADLGRPFWFPDPPG